MKILAVDTSHGRCSIALLDKDNLSVKEVKENSRQAEILLPLIEEILSENNLEYKDIDLLSSTIGPGSFTGLRIGMTAVKGIALATGKPTIGVNTLETIAFEVSNTDGKIISVLNAQRGQVYVQKFSVKGGEFKHESEAEILNLEEVKIDDDYTIIGNCNGLIDGVEMDIETYPHASLAAKLAAYKFSGESEDLTPLYVRPPDAKKAKKIFS